MSYTPQALIVMFLCGCALGIQNIFDVPVEFSDFDDTSQSVFGDWVYEFCFDELLSVLFGGV